MITYKNEIVEMPITFTSLINEKKLSELNELFNQRIDEGWELEAHTYLSSQSGSTNVMFITFKTAGEAKSKFVYKTEAVGMPTKWTRIIDEKELTLFDELFSEYMTEGWKLATHTFLSAGGGQPNVMLVTFNKAKHEEEQG